ncbi:tetratricopeptide repeat protein [Corynebacterium lizhenjunii]|uniref:tetratricopeptide repeat protein n=1 Tax=Corynebacterium lizhenjunii TaxID=2709394 RepID=UPI001F230B9F|nr:tetratricopeptide repeat protein [Corynebacterium lizhenjunii]
MSDSKSSDSSERRTHRDADGHRGRKKDGQRGSYSGGRGREDRRHDDRRDDQRDHSRDQRNDKRRDERREDRNGAKRDARGGSREDWGPRQGGRRRDDKRGEWKSGPRRGERKGGDRQHAGRGGRQEERKTYSPQRSGFREERLNRRSNDPDIPAEIDAQDLDPSVLQDLKSLAKDNADTVAKHMIMAAMWMDDDPQLALRHARAAKDRAGRVSVAREVNGIAAYRAGEWKEALAELRAARRMTGGPGLLAVMADCERGLGRPEKAIELSREPEAAALDPESAIELAIVVAGARHDLGQHESAVVTLQRANPSRDARGISACRLSYAYANALLLAGRQDEAKEWFEHTVAIDEGDWTDARERLEELS